jgi:hypothetical protein
VVDVSTGESSRVTDGDFDNAAWLDDDTLIVAPLRARVGVRSLL